MRTALGCFVLTALVIAAAWSWLGAPVAMPNAPLAPGEKLWCVSYAPFRGSQTPLDPMTHILAAQIEDDLTRLAQITECVRVYSTDYGLDQIAGIAAEHGLKVLQGLWLSSDPVKNRQEIDNAVAIANRYPNTVRAVVVGNEVLLRGEMRGNDLADTIRAVKARVKVPVTYADVWEFWLRNRDVASAVDFVTIHVLPYWEDLPVPATRAAAHVEAIRQQVARAFPGKEIVIGEVGWPSAGRMREGALPSPANQARVIQDVLALAKRERFKVNVIESFDAPWKRVFEGTVGGHWGLLDDASRAFKFQFGQPVSNHPVWIWQASGGIAFAGVIFAAAWLGGGERRKQPVLWLAVTVNALAGSILLGWAVENVPLESLGFGPWLRSLSMVAVAFLSPIAASAAVMHGTALLSLSRVLGTNHLRKADVLALVCGVVLIATLLLAIQIALGLVFDPRYKDFPFAPLSVAIVPLLTLRFSVKSPGAARGRAETAGAMLLALSVAYIVPNETWSNWQSLWLCAAFAALALTLFWVRAVPG
jgi:exo-beta-1,3-glucanase (GH17 family)